jgi:hypothetical protein
MHRANIQDGKYNSKEQKVEMEQAKVDKVQLVFKYLEAVHKEEIPECNKAHNMYLFSHGKW